MLTMREKAFLDGQVRPGEDVELEVADVVVAGEVDRRLEGHRLQARGDRVHLGIMTVMMIMYREMMTNRLVMMMITSLRVSLNIFQGTMVRSPKDVRQKSAASLEDNFHFKIKSRKQVGF